MSSRRSDSPWRKAVVRSRSLPRIGRSSSREDDAKPAKKQGVAAWAPGWLLTPQVSRGRRAVRKEPSYRPLIRRTPVLTLLLIRLDENMQGYCEQLSDPTVERAAAASAILEATVATASSPLSSPSCSSASSPPSHAPLSPLSPRSPRSSASAMLLEGEYEKYVSPLMLLAGAEAIFAQMEHVSHHETYVGLLSLYRKIEDDLIIVKETLCFPFLDKENSEKTNTTLPPEESTYLMAHKSASSLAKSLDAIMAITAVRRELISLHKDVFENASNDKDLLELSVRCRSLLKSVPLCDVSHCGPVLVMGQNLVAEMKALTAALACAQHLQRCSFMDTVLNAKVLKNNMRTTPSTVLQSWLRHTLENLLSIMPIFFDRVDAFAPALYGFDKSHMVRVTSGDRVGVVHDYETTILDFLRRQESKGGAPMAVTVILDAVRASSFHVERGYESGQQDQDSPSEEFPAVYMRTTLHLGSNNAGRSSNVRGKLGIASSAFRPSQKHLKNTSTRDFSLGADDFSTMSQSALRRSWSSDAGSPKNRRRKETHFHVLEYAPELGKSPWPHCEWDMLVPHLKSPDKTSDGTGPFSGPSMGGIVTYRSSELNSTAKTDLAGSLGISERSLDGSSTSASQTGMPWIGELGSGKQQIIPPPIVTRTPPGLPSVYHVSDLGENLWLVVIVKEEAAKWHRRKPRGYSDEDIHCFLQEMSSKLCVERLFSVATVKHVNKAVSSRAGARSISLNHFSNANKWRDVEVHHFLGSLKQSFGLRPQSPMRTPLKSPYQIGHYNRQRRRSLGAKESTQSSWDEADDDLDSAIAFFFGPELSACLQWQGY